MNRFNVIIIGGGPAGTATALSLVRLGHSVIVVERSQYENWRIGETLPPYGQMLLSNLGVWDRFLDAGHLPSYAIHSAWGSTDLYENDFIFNPYGTGWHIDRKGFDAMLAFGAEDAGVTVLRGARVRAVTHSADCWEVVVESEGATSRAQARFLVDATGRTSWIARSYGRKRLYYDRLGGLVGILTPQSTNTPSDQSLMLEAVEDGWWYSVPLPGGSLLVTYMTDFDYIARGRSPLTNVWSHKLACTNHTAARTSGFCLDGKVYARPASTCRLDEVSGEGWVAVGDAASAYDPLSAAGICRALRLGPVVAQTINDFLANNRLTLYDYAGRIKEEFEEYQQQRMKFYGRETRWPQSPFWRRRQSKSIQQMHLAATEKLMEAS